MQSPRLFKSLVLAASIALSAAAGTALAFPATGELNAQEATTLMDGQKKIAILDVRTPDEFADGHAQGAINIPVSELPARIGEVPAGPVLILCRSGMRAGNAYRILTGSGRTPESLWFLRGFTDYSSGTPRFR